MLQTFCLCLLSTLVGLVVSSANERRLVTELLKPYDKQNAKYTRPVEDDASALDVTHGLSLVGVDMVDPFLDRAIINIWQTVSWKDSMLKWDPNEFGGISSIRLPLDRIYTPDLLIYQQERPLLTTDVLAVVSSDGTVLMVQPGKAYLSCPMENVPWHDKQSEFSCSFKFGSWTTSTNLLNPALSSDKIDVTNYVPYFGFDLVGTSAKRNDVKYECCPETYANLEYTITFKRAAN